MKAEVRDTKVHQPYGGTISSSLEAYHSIKILLYCVYGWRVVPSEASDNCETTIWMDLAASKQLTQFYHPFL